MDSQELQPLSSGLRQSNFNGDPNDEQNTKS